MVNIIVTSDSRYPINRLSIQATVLDALHKHNVYDLVELGINIVGSRKMHQINKKYRGIDSPANILTFALEDSRGGFIAAPDKILRLGDILISYPQVLEDASLDGLSVDQEIKMLLEHGINHLLGHHHS